MGEYNYYKAVREDIIEELNELKGAAEMDEDDIDSLFFNYDSITGNASGSYAMNAYGAEECLCHNWDLLEEALEEFGYAKDFNPISMGPEWCDVIIRCYVFGEVFHEAYEEWRAENEKRPD